MKLIEIFKAGKRPDANGTVVEITIEQLAEAVNAYDPAFHEAPIVIGHPKSNLPAYAWVKGLQLEGETLKAELHQIDPEFAELVEKGRYKKVSAAFYLPDSPNNPKQGTLYLRHVGFLGAMPPAVKGLKEAIFSEEEGVVAFTEQIDPAISTPQGVTMTPEEIAALQAENERLKAEKAQAEEAKAQAEAEKAQAEAEKQQAQLEKVQADNLAYAEGLIAQGKLAPVAKEAALALLNCSATTACGLEPEFNEGENLLTLTKALLEAQPQAVMFGEFATADKAGTDDNEGVQYAESDDPARIALDRKARAYMKEHNVDYATAIAAVA